MKIKSLYIKKYKILEEFEINFNHDINTHVIIGKNGSGKTTLFEAIINIFKSCLEVSNWSALKKEYFQLGLEFNICYELKSSLIKISYLNNKLEFTKDHENLLEKNLHSSNHELSDAFHYEPKKISDFLPDHIVTYYSGESTRVTSLFEKELKNSADRLQKRKNIPLRMLINIDTRYLKKVLISLLPLSGKAFGKLVSIDEIIETEIFFKKPKWSIGAEKRYKQEVEINSEDALLKFNPDFYFAEGEVGKFLETISKFSLKSFYANSGHVKSLKFELNDMWDYFEMSSDSISKDPTELFKLIDHTEHSGLIDSIRMEIKLKSGAIAEIDNLSEGELQISLVLGLAQIFKEKETLFLFDEPDTYLHPEWQQKLMDKLTKLKNTSIFVTSHSTTALSAIHTNNIISLNKGKIIPIEGLKTFAAKPEIVLNEIQNAENSIIKNLKPEIDRIWNLIEENDFDKANLLINKLEEKFNIDSTYSFIEDLRLAIKRKKLFG